MDLTGDRAIQCNFSYVKDMEFGPKWTTLIVNILYSTSTVVLLNRISVKQNMQSGVQQGQSVINDA
jgi:hypothetical protein